MNRSKIEWCDHTWNPITGCRHNCEYCYARRMTMRFSGDVRLNLMAKDDYKEVEAADGSGPVYVLEKPMMNETGNALVYPFGFEPTLHMHRMDTLDKLKMGNNIFVGAMADVFGEWVPDDWIDKIMEICLDRPQHNYIFLTKNVERYCEYGVPMGKENMWYGTSVTRESEMSRFNSLPAGCRRFVSMEPILEDLHPEEHNILFRQVGWIILGAETGNRKEKVVPDRDWIMRIVAMADEQGVPVFMKDSLVPIVGEESMRREFPEGLMRKTISQKMRNRLFDECINCKMELRKSDMTALLARTDRGITAKQVGYICDGCLNELFNKWGIELSNIKNMED